MECDHVVGQGGIVTERGAAHLRAEKGCNTIAPAKCVGYQPL
jgi:hypothetical protein